MAKRKMSPEQRAAAAERLAKAREKRLRENPPQYKNIDPTVLARERGRSLLLSKGSRLDQNSEGVVIICTSILTKERKGCGVTCCKSPSIHSKPRNLFTKW